MINRVIEWSDVIVRFFGCGAGRRSGLFIIGLVLCLVLPVGAQVVTFDFDTGFPSLTPGQITPLDQDSGGVIAHFSAASGLFSTQNDLNTGLRLDLFSGNYLYPNSAFSVLVIQFSQQMTNIAFNFATVEQTPIGLPTPVRLTVYTNSISTPAVGTITTAGAYGHGTLPMGTIHYSSLTPFNVVKLNIEPGGGTGFLIDNVTNRISGSASYTIATSASPPEGGTTSGDGTYLSGSTITVTANPNPGYAFVNWTENGIEVSTLALYSFNADSFRTLVANFVSVYTVTTSASPTAGGTTTGDGLYNSGSVANLIASPNPGYAFVNWTENGVPVSSWPNWQLSISSDRTLVANFAAAWTITTSPSSASAGSTAGNGTYPAGSTVTVVATPGTGNAFANWTENGQPITNSPVYSFTASGNRALVANFVPSTANVTFDFDTATPALTNSQTTPFDQTAGGLTAHFSATNEPGFSVQSDAALGWVLPYFASNYLAPYLQASVLNIQFSQPLAGVTLSFATFDLADLISPSTIELTAFADAAGMTPVGSATAQGSYYAGNSMPMGGLSFASATPFRSITLAMPSSEQGATDFIVDNIAVQIAAVSTCTITTSASPGAGGTTSGDGTYNFGVNVMVIAEANPGYTFVNWTESGTVVSAANRYTFGVMANRTLVANFAPIYTIATSASPIAGGTTSGGGIFTNGASVTVVATANPGYAFVNWTENGTPVSSSASYTFTASANRSLVANFTPACTITASASPGAGGTVSGGGTYNSGLNVTVIATANPGYAFLDWTENGVPVSTAASYTFVTIADRTLVANFVQILTVAVSASPGVGGTVTGGGAYKSGSGVTVVATANTGYAFANWTEGGTLVSTAPSYSFTASANRTLVANFVQGFTVAVSASPSMGGAVTGAGTYISGSNVTVVAVANGWYVFVNWTEGSTPVSTSATYTFTASANRTLVANFLPTCTIAVSASPGAGGVVSGAGTYTSSSNVTVVATAKTGYAFLNWTEGGSEVSTAASYSFTASVDRTLAANFAPLLSVLFTSTNTLAVSWPAASPGYVLQENSALGNMNWANTTNKVDIVGDYNQIIVSTFAGSGFYRLFHP